jgi:hypothetical protein
MVLNITFIIFIVAVGLMTCTSSLSSLYTVSFSESFRLIIDRVWELTAEEITWS